MGLFSWFKRKTAKETGISNDDEGISRQTAIHQADEVDHAVTESKTVEAELSQETLHILPDILTNTDVPKKESVYEKFISQFEYDSKTEVAFVYHEGETELFQSVLLIAKYALRHARLTPLFTNDSDVMYITVFDKKLYDYIGLMDYALHFCKVRTSLTVYGTRAVNLFLDIRRHGVGTLHIYKDNITYKKIIESEEFQDAEFASFASTTAFETINNLEVNTRNYIRQNCRANLDIYKQVLRSILESLTIDKTLYVRWKREYEMYLLVKMYYPDVVFQYHSQWLDRQSLDAYVPSIKVGFEYQGQQHFESVDFFGGQEALERREVNDSIKKKKCKQNNVALVEWMYTEQINSSILAQKLDILHITLPDKPADLFVKRGIEEISIDNDAINLDRCQDPKELFHKALDLGNIEAIYTSFQKLVRKNPKTVTKYWESLLSKLTDEQLSLLQGKAAFDGTYGDSILTVLSQSERLTEYYLCCDNVRNNFTTRKIILYLIKNGNAPETVASYLERMRKQIIKHGGTRGEYNSGIKCLYSEAADYGISKQEIQEILLKIGIKRKS